MSTESKMKITDPDDAKNLARGVLALRSWGCKDMTEQARSLIDPQALPAFISAVKSESVDTPEGSYIVPTGGAEAGEKITANMVFLLAFLGAEGYRLTVSAPDGTELSQWATQRTEDIRLLDVFLGPMGVAMRALLRGDVSVKMLWFSPEHQVFKKFTDWPYLRIESAAPVTA